MPRGYRHIQNYEKEILELRSQGKTGLEIQENFGFGKKQYDNFITRFNRRQEKIAATIAIKKKGRPAKDSVVTKEDHAERPNQKWVTDISYIKTGCIVSIGYS